MWGICLIISMSCILVDVVLSIAVYNSKLFKNRKIGPFNLLFAGVFIANFFLFFPIHIMTGDAKVLDVWRAVMLSIFNSVQMFTIGCEFSIIEDGMLNCPDLFDSLYQLWAAILFVLAPVFTFGIILSLFKNISAYFKYLLQFNRKTYVFSELNEKSIVLAGDIKRNNKNVSIVFTDVFEDNDEQTYELIGSAKKLGAIFFKEDILVIDFNKHSRSKSISFFAIGSDESENLNQSLKLIDNYRNRINTHLYVFSTKIDSELLLNAIDKGLVKVRRINEVQSLVNRLLYEEGCVLFDSARDGYNGDKIISAVVVGMGAYGTEMIKALSWFGQMNGYKLEINAFDRNPLAEEQFIATAPELMAPDYNGVDIEGEAQYKITIHSSIDVTTITFANEISKITDATYVMVALGSDEINIKTAVNLRMYFERLKIHPVIHAIVFNTKQKNALKSIKNYRGDKYDIGFIGDIESSYAQNVIISSELEEDALKRHLKWGKEEEFWNYDYNYRSSMASAIHMKARIKCGIPGADKRAEDLSEEERTIIEILEHRRWNAYMRSEGYIFSGSKDKSSRNDLAKMHHDLVDYSSLNETTKRLDSKVGTH